MESNELYHQSISFAIEMMTTNEYLRVEKKEFVISKKLLLTTTSMVMNIEIALTTDDPEDFIAFTKKVSKKLNQIDFYIRLLKTGEYLTEEMFKILDQERRKVKNLFFQHVSEFQKKINQELENLPVSDENKAKL